MAQELAIYDSPEFRSKLYSGLVALFRSMRTTKDAYLAERLGQSFTDSRASEGPHVRHYTGTMELFVPRSLP